MPSIHKLLWPLHEGKSRSMCLLVLTFERIPSEAPCLFQVILDGELLVRPGLRTYNLLRM